VYIILITTKSSGKTATEYAEFDVIQYALGDAAI
jgi:hypothetical protein